MQQTESLTGGLLFVCTGNICRSPMAAALFANAGAGDYGRMGSAGLRSIDGQSAHPLAVEQMQRRGIDLSTHRARSITPDLLIGSDVVLVMEAAHKAWIQRNMPVVGRRVHLLGHWRNCEIIDPVKGNRSDFDKCARQIERCLRDWVARTRNPDAGSERAVARS